MTDVRIKEIKSFPNFAELLTLLFIGLKLTGHIDWSWWWVLAPAWIVVLIAISDAVDLIRERE